MTAGQSGVTAARLKLERGRPGMISRLHPAAACGPISEVTPMPDIAPQDPDFDARVRASFERQAAMASLGISILRLEAGRIELAMPYNAAFTQQHGFVHAGIMATALDSACGYAAFSLMPANAAVLTIEFKTNLMAPAKGELFTFRGRVVKPGRTITVAEAEAFAHDGGASKLVASMTATLMAVTGREGIQH
jgi:uncharacterized protein (TIGR00369 family)